MSEQHESGSGPASSNASSSGTSWERDLLNRLAFASLNEERRRRRWGIFFRIRGMTAAGRSMAARAVRAGLWLGLSLVVGGASADELTASQIVERAHAAAGGQAWLAAGTNLMMGHATLCRDGDPSRCVVADRYEMYRVYPTELEHGAHAASGKFRLDAYAGDKVLFKVAFDGERSYDQNGPVPPERASGDEISAFGFSAIFALRPGFAVERLTDDQVEGHPCYFVRVTDPTGARTLFGIDQQTHAVRSAGWQTPKGFHFYFKYVPGIKNGVRVLLDTDIRNDGGYVIAPPSGGRYQWIN